MKKESWTCDICENPTSAANVFEAYLEVREKIHMFHVCRTCYSTTPKGVFQKAFNALFRITSGNTK